ncbi:MAG: 1-phosphofructokinase family hexose kinase [Gammaproteobacteria bacterium]|nr:1-phosphofructokinase family hexose kinase [Gammaproteobacteria bacterium]
MNIITVTPNPAIDVTIGVADWQRGSVNRGQSLVNTIGGKALNVAINLAQSGLPVEATGWIGSENDELFVQRFAKDNVKDTFIRVSGKTRQNIKVVDTTTQETTDFNMSSFSVDDKAIGQLSDYLSSSVQLSSVLVFGGSLPSGIGVDYYTDNIKTYRDKCQSIIVDTSGKALLSVLQSDTLPSMIKPNIHELRHVTGKALATDKDIIEEARQWIAKGIELLVVSMGSQGAWFVTADKAVKALPLSVKVASTVGAGDAMVAGTVRGMLEQLDLADIAKMGTAYSAVNIENVATGISSQARLEEFISAVVVEQFIF